LNKIIRPDYGTDAEYQQLAIDSIPIWREWSKDAVERFGKPLFNETGVVFLCSSPKPSGFVKASMETLNSKVLSQIIDSNFGKFPGLRSLTRHFQCGYVNHLAGWGNSKLAVEYLAQKITEMGAEIISGPKGKFSKFIYAPKSVTTVIGIETTDGTRYYGSKIIMATGSWTGSLIPELSGVLQSTGQPVIHIQLPKYLIPAYSYPNFTVWSADITKTGFYGFPANKEGIIKIAHHGSGYFAPVPEKDSGPAEPRTVVTHPNDNIPRDALLRFKSFLNTHFPELAQLNITSTRMCWYFFGILFLI
jgi:sarcosine oxidase/L-pipecolate oxidase